MSQLVACSQSLALLETNLARHINIKGMDLSMGGNELALGIVDCAGVVDLVIGRVAFGDRTTNNVGICILYQRAICQSTDQVESSVTRPLSVSNYLKGTWYITLAMVESALTEGPS